MRILIYSDVHGNLPAFEQMLKEAGTCEAYISLGDLVNYGPWSNECVDLALSLPCAKLIMGNHEEAYLQGSYPGTNVLVQQFLNKTIPSFTKINLIKKFLPDYILGNFVCTHTIQNSYIYPDTNVQLDKNYIIGHSHHQFKYQSNDCVLYNAGSVGQNRKYINAANYLVYDADTAGIVMQQVVFNVDIIINEMKARHYPEACVKYYSQKERI
jgi:predicted phosphodiesterase